MSVESGLKKERLDVVGILLEEVLKTAFGLKPVAAKVMRLGFEKRLAG